MVSIKLSADRMMITGTSHSLVGRSQFGYRFSRSSTRGVSLTLLLEMPKRFLPWLSFFSRFLNVPLSCLRRSYAYSGSQHSSISDPMLVCTDHIDIVLAELTL